MTWRVEKGRLIVEVPIDGGSGRRGGVTANPPSDVFDVSLLDLAQAFANRKALQPINVDGEPKYICEEYRCVPDAVAVVIRRI